MMSGLGQRSCTAARRTITFTTSLLRPPTLSYTVERHIISKQYAYGINFHVGPVTGWQPPVAPNRKHVRQSHPLWKRLERLGARAALGVRFIKYAWAAWRNRLPPA